jgi:hypothetical protein
MLANDSQKRLINIRLLLKHGFTTASRLANPLQREGFIIIKIFKSLIQGI